MKNTAIVILDDALVLAGAHGAYLSEIIKYINSMGWVSPKVYLVGSDQSAAIDLLKEIIHQYKYIFTIGGLEFSEKGIAIESIAKAFDAKLTCDAFVKERLERIHCKPSEDLSDDMLRFTHMPMGYEFIGFADFKHQPLISLNNVIMLSGFNLASDCQTLHGFKYELINDAKYVTKSIDIYFGENTVFENYDSISASSSSIMQVEFDRFENNLGMSVRVGCFDEIRLLSEFDRILSFLDKLGVEYRV